MTHIIGVFLPSQLMQSIHPEFSPPGVVHIKRDDDPKAEQSLLGVTDRKRDEIDDLLAKPLSTPPVNPVFRSRLESVTDIEKETVWAEVLSQPAMQAKLKKRSKDLVTYLEDYGPYQVDEGFPDVADYYIEVKVLQDLIAAEIDDPIFADLKANNGQWVIKKNAVRVFAKIHENAQQRSQFAALKVLRGWFTHEEMTVGQSACYSYRELIKAMANGVDPTLHSERLLFINEYWRLVRLIQETDEDDMGRHLAERAREVIKKLPLLAGIDLDKES